LFLLKEFGAVARTYPIACSGVRQRNFDFVPQKLKRVGDIKENIEW
jgi:hypothetical protein